ncbi:ArdC family protein [Pectobacterium jejuense]
MTISLHTQTSAPNTAAATSVSPLEQPGSSKTKLSQTRTDIYQTVTDNIIAALEAGVKPWSCPWQRVPGIRCPENSQAAGAGCKESVHHANGVCTSVIAVNDCLGMTADGDVCRTATVAGPVFGVMISVLCRVIRTYLMQESNHDRETTQHAERDHDSRACLTGKSA